MRIAELITQIDGVGYVARGAVNDAGNVARTKRMVVEAFTAQQQGRGLSFVEILTMCPTGWFVPTGEAPDYEAAYRVYERGGFAVCGAVLDYPDSGYSRFYEKKITK